MRNGIRKKMLAILLSACLGTLLLAGCSSSSDSQEAAGTEETASADSAEEEKVFIFGDTTFNAENEEADVNPHNTYAGWACIRYGIGETLFKYSDDMEIEPWIAQDYELMDEWTWKITLREDVIFSNGRTVDADAVKECLEHLIEVHDRAAGDLMIDTITADGYTLTITTTERNPALINYLSDPYGCIIDMEAGITEDGIVIGTGPYVVESLETGAGLDLVKNENYWNGEPGYDRIQVLTITDGDTLTMALQSGEIDAAYGFPYASCPLFEGEASRSLDNRQRISIKDRFDRRSSPPPAASSEAAPRGEFAKGLLSRQSAGRLRRLHPKKN